ncbi:SDR family NAD(P)-dependent oxidoreductase [Mesorhizobium sp. YR577]|uniref:SDR family NAD(P)-dependent oxidoreductase n=1 Tax=Mesorhizobium sp. YR577 TaxID=1884373 RepID=UPI0008EF0E26|nr:SDR family NAD(P)-dependent oxidoreductase [Mesorhizobium sp. YR577]SFU21173.1 NADP-dependent 3-hydroxy acid dehydrogenase YdfG [Mesorhizobium sp. YR577]
MQKVAMISGASRGIGAAIAKRLVENGWAVSLGMRKPDEAPQFSPELMFACPFDALDRESERNWVAATAARFGRIDGLVHNAGIAPRKTVLEASDDEFDLVFNVNVKSPMRLTREAWPHLVASRGRIVTMASLSGKRVKSPGAGLYALSKFAAVGLAHALRQCGKESGVRSTAICPSYVATDMSATMTEAPAAELTQPEDIAKIVHMVLELPATASIAEIPVHWTVEDCF